MKKIIFYSSIIILFLCGSNSHAESTPTKILILGDSLSAGYGINVEDGWVRLLENRLNDKAPNSYKVINASISGNTTSMGAGRLPKLLRTHKPNIVIIELGGNDGLQGHPLKLMRTNLSNMIELSQAANAKVLLAGIQIPPNYGKRYADEFFASFGLIAEKYNVALVPFMLDDIAIHPELMQPDGVHPKAKAQPKLLDNIWLHLEKLL